MENRVLKGDCLEVLNNFADNSIDLIYLDPPFYTQKTQKLKSFKIEKIYEFEDSWSDIDEYLDYMRSRLKLMRKKLKKDGSIFLHVDKTAVHHLKIVMDEIFGTTNFKNEIIWTYKKWTNSKKSLQNVHQNILFYTKSKDNKFNILYEDYSKTTNLDQTLQKRVRVNGKVEYKKNEGKIEYIEEKKGVPLSDVWNIPYLNPKAKERCGYPTQKPISLLERIIKISTNEGDLVVDPFCGSGSTLVAAKKLKRKYVGIDKSEDAICLSKKRIKEMIITESNLLKEGMNSYDTKTDREKAIINSLGAKIVYRNTVYDAIKNTDEGLYAIKIDKNDIQIEDIIEDLKLEYLTGKFKKIVLITNKKISQNFEWLIIINDLFKK